MTKILAPIGITVLVVTAIVLGYTIIQQSPNQQSITPQVSTNNSTATSPTTNQLSADEIAALNFPGPNATDAEKKKHTELVDRLAVESSVLNITNCQPSPVILKAKQGSTITIKNDSPVSQTMHWGNIDIVVSSSSQKVVNFKEEFGENIGIIGYICLGSNTPGGIIRIYNNP